MSGGGAIPNGDRIEWVRACLRLEFQEPFFLTVEHVLRLRRNLRQAARQGANLALADFVMLFDPPVSTDLFAQRRYQLPGPPFVIHPPSGLPRLLAAGEQVEVPVILLGRGAYLLRELCRVWQSLGTRGLHRGEGRFELVAVEAEDLAGNRAPIWEGERSAPLPLVLTRVDWWLDGPPQAAEVSLSFSTPARLLSNGRPLFRPTFETLFPFVLRRVTSMVHAHCDVELIADPAPLLAAARQVVVVDNGLRWRDWRSLEGEESRQDLGGVMGRLVVSGDGLPEILWVLQFGSLLNLGKGAAFGAGHLVLGEMV